MINRPETAREVLDIIDNALTELPVGEAIRLWDVLSALRGPDQESQDLKNKTTAPIRTAAFPRTGSRGKNNQLPATFAPVTSFDDSALRFATGHFKVHVQFAAEALDLFDFGQRKGRG